MANLGRLAVAIGADTSEFDSAMNQTQSKMGQFATRARSVINAGAAIGVGMAAAGAAIMTRFVSAQFAAIDSSAKLARSLGTTTASVATLERAGQLAGVAMSGIEQATKDLTRRLSQAAGGAGPAAEALDRLGLTAQQLQQMPLDQRIATINQAIRDFIPAAEQAAVAGQLFGEEGSIAMQRIDPETIQEAARQATAFGTAVSDVDASTIERANDALSAIGLVLQGVFRRIAVQVAPMVEHLANMFVEAAIESEGFGDQVAQGMEYAVRGIAFAADAVRGLQVAFAAVKAAVAAVANASVQLAATISGAFVRVLSDIQEKVRSTVELVNRISIVDIPLDGLDALRDGLSSTQTFITELADSSALAAQDAAASLQALAMTPMPSEGFLQFFDQVREASAAASEQVIADRQAMFGLGGDDEGGGQDSELEAMRAAQQQRLEQLRESLLTEREAELEHHAERMEMLRQAKEQELEIGMSYQEAMEREEQRHRDRLTQLASQGAKSVADETIKQGQREIQTRQQQMQALQTGVSNILGAMAQENKAFGIAQAIINTWRGVSESLAAYPFPVSAVMAAASLAAGLQTVRNIQGASTKGGGGGAGGAVAGGGAAATAPAAAQQARPQQEQSRTATINVQGDVFSREGVMGLMDQMNELMADGYTGVTFA